MVVPEMVTNTKVIGAIDQRMAAAEFNLFDCDSEMIKNILYKYRQIYPESRWIEHDPSEIWENTTHLIRRGSPGAGYTMANLEPLRERWQAEETFNPANIAPADELYEAWQVAVGASRGWGTRQVPEED